MIKYFLIFLIPSLAMANWYGIDGDEIKGAYANKQSCEARTGLECHPCNAGGDCGFYSIQEVMVDDTDRPIHDVQNVTPCESQEECESLVADPEFCLDTCVEIDGETTRCHRAIWREDTMEASCVRTVGYEQKEVERFLFDESKHQAHLDEIAQRAQEREDHRQNVRGEMQRLEAQYGPLLELLEEMGVIPEEYLK